jgi:fibronectin type 3 domain-containing protein
MTTKRVRLLALLLAPALWMVLWPIPRALYAQSGHSVTLTITAPTTGGAVATYNIKRGATTGSETPLTTIPASQTTYVDSTGTSGQTYFYIVTAVNATGEGPKSNEVMGSFLLDLPGAPALQGANN